jgi:hypothetical protein
MRFEIPCEHFPMHQASYFLKLPEMAGIFKGFEHSNSSSLKTQPFARYLLIRAVGVYNSSHTFSRNSSSKIQMPSLFFHPRRSRREGTWKGKDLRKFNDWLRTSCVCTNLLKKDDEIIVGRFTVLVSIVLRKNHPHSLQITEAFDQLIVDASEKPED